MKNTTVSANAVPVDAGGPYHHFDERITPEGIVTFSNDFFNGQPALKFAEKQCSCQSQSCRKESS